MFTRYAYAEAHVLEVKGSRTKQHTASLNTVAGFENYRTDDGYMYVRIRAISSRVNKNHDGWPTTELAGSPEILAQHKHASDSPGAACPQCGQKDYTTDEEGDRHCNNCGRSWHAQDPDTWKESGFTVEAKNGNKKRGFASFNGKPIFVDHNNTDPEKGRGVIVDSKFRVLDQKTASEDKYWKSADVDKEHLPASEVELLLEVDSKAYPKFAKAIRDGDLDGFSMGANVEYTKCSHCGNVAHDAGEFCSHVLMKGANHDIKTAEGRRVSKKSYENCYGVGFFEISGVFDPADETALAREVRASVPGSVHEAELYDRTPEGIAPLHDDPLRGRGDQWVQMYADHLVKNYGYDESTALQMAQDKVQGEGMGLDQPAPGPGNADGYGLPATTMEAAPPAVMNAPVHNDPRWGRTAQFKDPMKHVAENPLPQDMQTKAPDEVDTLRSEQVCPVCGNDMDGEQCDVCGYVAPPKEFDNPDLTKAQEVRDEMKEMDNQESNPQSPAPDPSAATATPPPGPAAPPPGPPTSKPPATARVNSDTMRNWTPKVNARTAARINQVERPIRPTGQTTNEPKDEVVISDQAKPVTSAMRTARQLIAQTQSGETMQTRTADGPTPPGDTSADARVDVTGVGGFMDASNEQASKANAQVDVTGVGGTGVEGVEADSTETLPTAGESTNDSGFNEDKTTEDSGPTKTYEDSDGSHSGVSDPVTSETPYWVDESKWSRVNLSADGDDKTLEQQEQQGDPVAGGGSAVKGVQPVAEEFGERVNVLEHKTSPSNNSGPTKTWSGTDGNGVLKQQEPTTQDSMEWGGVKTPDVKLHTTSAAHHINVDRLVDLEEGLGLLPHEDRWNRMASLHRVDPREVLVQIETLAKVKTAGTKMAAQQRLATRIPRAIGAATTASHDFQRIASEGTPAQPVHDADLDSALFSR